MLLLLTVSASFWPAAELGAALHVCGGHHAAVDHLPHL